MILQAFIRGAIVIGLAAIIATLLRNRSAALRHHVWATAVVVQLSLLAFIPVLPTIYLPVIPTLRVQTDAVIEQPSADAFAAGSADDNARSTEGAAVANPRSSVSPAPEAPIAPKRSPTDYLILVWLIGLAVVFARYVIGTLLMLRVSMKGERVEDGEWLVLAQRTARELGITRPVTMIWGDHVSVPITWGVLYPMILLPKSAHEWPQERRRFVLVHEMAHVKRFDALTQLLAQITAAIFWFSPFVWLAEWRMRIEREHACDDTVIQYGTDATMYASELLQMVRTLVRRRSPQPAFAALAMARKSEFEGRMLAILDPERPRRVTGITSGVMFAVLSVLIAAPLAAIDPFAFNVETEPQAAERAMTTTPAPASTAARVPTQALNTPAVTRSECDFESTSIGTTANVQGNPQGIEIRLKRARRCLTADISGPVSISPDEKRILAVENGGFVRVVEFTPARTVQLMIERTSGAGVQRAFTINGRVPDDDGRNEREWLARVLPELLTEGAIDVQQRVTRMIQANGLNGTLSQIAALTSVSARVAHFRELVAIGNWTDAEIARIRTSATKSLAESPTDLAAFERALPRKTDTQPAPRAAAGTQPRDVELMEQVLKGISSGYDLQVAMKAQLYKADRDMLLVFARAATRITSGYDLSSFLIAARPYYLGRNDIALEDAWFGLAARIGSSSDRGRTLNGVLDHVQGNERKTLKLIGAMRGMSSTVDKASLLTAIAKRKLLFTPDLRAAFLAEVNTLSSGVDRRMVLEAL